MYRRYNGYIINLEKYSRYDKFRHYVGKILQ